MERIKANINIDPLTGCWNWQKSVTSAGYGQLTENKKYWTTHRYVYNKIYGEIPNGLVIRHLCHNTKCCNPEHLAIGTQRDNWLDSEELHRKSHIKNSKRYIINGKEYLSCYIVRRELGLSLSTIFKYTDSETRIFDVNAYRNGCIKARVIPKV